MQMARGSREVWSKGGKQSEFTLDRAAVELRWIMKRQKSLFV